MDLVPSCRRALGCSSGRPASGPWRTADRRGSFGYGGAADGPARPRGGVRSPARAGRGSRPRRGRAPRASLPCRTSSPGCRPPPRSRSSSTPTRRPCRPGLQRLGGAVAGELLQRPGDDDGQPLERARSLVDLVLLGAHPGLGATARRSSLVPVDVEPVAHGLADDRADPVDGGELLGGGRARCASMVRNSRASACAAVGPTWRMDSADQHPPQRPGPGRVDRVEQLAAVGGAARRPCAEQRRPGSACPRRGRRRRPRPATHPGVAAARPRLRSRARRCRRRRDRRRGRCARAAGPGTTGCWGSGCRRRPPSRAELGAALGAARRHDELALAAVAQVDDRSDDLGDDVAGLAQHDRVADQHTLARDLRRRCAASPGSPWSR